MHILFLNQYAPPDPSPTARLLGELADYLRAKGHSVDVISQRNAYQGHHVASVSRIQRELGAIGTILRAGLARRGQRRPDFVVSLSSPPCLLVAASLIAWRRRAPLVHWAMDLYPELAITLGEVRPGSPVAAVLRRLMSWAYRRCAFIVALDDDMADHLRRTYRVHPKVLPPWPPSAADPDAGALQEESPPGARLATDAWTWLYSGNLGRAHEWQSLLDTQATLERQGLPVQLVFEGGGPNWQPARAYAQHLGLQRCLWTGYVSEAQSFRTLQASRLVVATQKRAALGLLWPSKLARIIPLPKPLLWIGPAEGAVARSLCSRADTACFEPDRSVEMAQWIAELYRRDPSFPSAPLNTGKTSQAYEERLRASCQQWEKWLSEALE
ncbi:MAG: glycosyltransferase [Rhodospirillales bacterium]|nr:glycosyltransferase [Acetobacter sp.]